MLRATIAQMAQHIQPLTSCRRAGARDCAIAHRTHPNNFAAMPIASRRAHAKGVGGASASDETPRAVATGGSYTAPEPCDWRRQFLCEINGADYILALFTIVLAASTIGLWISTHRLWQSGERTARAIESANVFVEVAIDDGSTTGAEIENRGVRAHDFTYVQPWDFIGPPAIPPMNVPIEVVNVVVSFWNYGRTPAIVRNIYPNSVAIGNPAKGPIAEFEQRRLPRGLAIDTGKADRIKMQINLSRMVQIWAEYNKTPLMVYGAITYLDVMNEKRETGFCWEMGKAVRPYQGLRLGLPQIIIETPPTRARRFTPTPPHSFGVAPFATKILAWAFAP